MSMYSQYFINMSPEIGTVATAYEPPRNTLATHSTMLTTTQNTLATA